MARRPYDSCPYRNIQQFTEVCLDCGHNVYEEWNEVERERERILNSPKKQDDDDDWGPW